MEAANRAIRQTLQGAHLERLVERIVHHIGLSIEYGSRDVLYGREFLDLG